MVRRRAMFTIKDLIDSIRSNRIRITDHADEEAHADRVSFEDVFTSVLQGEIIEEYPKDKPFPSCLVFGMNMKNDPIHSVWGYNINNRWAVLITVYRPDPERWIDWRVRRNRDETV